jgi:hypothetical protein
VQELTANPRLVPFADHVVLLRPDRYVAACIAAGELDEAADRVRALLAGTFEASDGLPPPSP